MAQTANIQVSSRVTFADGRRADIQGAKVTGIRDEYHLNLLLDNGKSLTNVPHASYSRPVGWYSINPNETMTPVNAATYKASA